MLSITRYIINYQIYYQLPDMLSITRYNINSLLYYQLPVDTIVSELLQAYEAVAISIDCVEHCRHELKTLKRNKFIFVKNLKPIFVKRNKFIFV